MFSASTTGTLHALLFRGSCILKRVAEYLMKLKWYDLEWGKTDDIFIFIYCILKKLKFVSKLQAVKSKFFILFL